MMPNVVSANLVMFRSTIYNQIYIMRHRMKDRYWPHQIYMSEKAYVKMHRGPGPYTLLDQCLVEVCDTEVEARAVWLMSECQQHPVLITDADEVEVLGIPDFTLPEAGRKL